MDVFVYMWAWRERFCKQIDETEALFREKKKRRHCIQSSSHNYTELSYEVVGKEFFTLKRFVISKSLSEHVYVL